MMAKDEWRIDEYSEPIATELNRLAYLVRRGSLSILPVTRVIELDGGEMIELTVGVKIDA